MQNVIVLPEENVGCVSSFRKLLTEAYNYIDRVDYFAFADQDDVWLPEKLKSGASILAGLRQEVPSMYCSNLTVTDENLNPYGLMHTSLQVPDMKCRSLFYNIATGCTLLFNKRMVELFHTHPPKFLKYHDAWIYQTCLFLGDVYYDMTPHILYRQHGNNVEGAHLSSLAKLRHKLKKLTNSAGHTSDEVARELLEVYGKSGLLSSVDSKHIGILAEYKKSFRSRLRLLFPPKDSGLNRQEAGYNLILKLRIIFGYL